MTFKLIQDFKHGGGLWFFTGDILAVAIIGGWYWHLVSGSSDDSYPSVLGPVLHSWKFFCVPSDILVSCWVLSRTCSSYERISHFSLYLLYNWSSSIIPIPIKSILHFLLFSTSKSSLLILMLMVVLFLCPSMPPLFYFLVCLVQNSPWAWNPDSFFLSVRVSDCVMIFSSAVILKL